MAMMPSSGSSMMTCSMVVANPSVVIADMMASVMAADVVVSDS